MADSIAASEKSRCDAPSFRLDVRAELIPLLIFGVGLPVVLTSVNYVVLQFGTNSQWPLEVTLPVYCLYIVEIGLLGYAVGIGLHHPIMKWLVFVWAMVLIDLQMFVAVALTPRDWYWQWSPEKELPYALFAGQLGMLTIWGVLGGTPAKRRLPLVAIAVALTVYVGFSGNGFSERSTVLLFSQSVATILLCGLIWMRGYRIERTLPASAPRGIGLGERFQFLVRRRREQQTTAVLRNTLPQGHRMQFSLWHVFLWVSGLAPLLAVARLLDWTDVIGAAVVRVVELVCLSVCMAIVTVVALWAALGKEHFARRWAVLVLLAPAIGFAFSGMLSLSEWTEMTRYVSQPATTWLDFADFMGEKLFSDETISWSAWTILSSFFLAGMLLIFRASGYGLFRRIQTTPTEDSEG